MITRAHVVNAMLSLIGTPYLWAAKGEVILQADGSRVVVPPFPDGRRRKAFDCSGAVGEALRLPGLRDRRFTWNSDSYWNELPLIVTPLPGDVALYGGDLPNDVSHIEMVTSLVDGMVLVCGASSGDRSTTTFEEAAARNAMIKPKTTHLYRRDFRGFRSITSLLGP